MTNSLIWRRGRFPEMANFYPEYLAAGTGEKHIPIHPRKGIEHEFGFVGSRGAPRTNARTQRPADKELRGNSRPTWPVAPVIRTLDMTSSSRVAFSASRAEGAPSRRRLGALAGKSNARMLG